jgi:hypothetical protein
VPNRGEGLAGMTVNERLFVAGRPAEFDAATRAEDRDRMIEILEALAVADAERSVDRILADRRRDRRG